MHFDREIEEGSHWLALEQIDKEAEEEPDHQESKKNIVDYLPRFGRYARQTMIKEAHGYFDEGDGGEEGNLINAAGLFRQVFCQI